MPSALSFSDRMIFRKGCIFHPIHLCIGTLQSPCTLEAFYCLWTGMFGQPQKLTGIPKIYERGVIEGMGKRNSWCLTWYYWQATVSLCPGSFFIPFELACLASPGSRAAEKVNPGIQVVGHFFFAKHLSQKRREFPRKQRKWQKIAANDNKWQKFLQKWRENTPRFFSASDARHLTFSAALLRRSENLRSWKGIRPTLPIFSTENKNSVQPTML